jgi:hypothetical protein
MLSDINALEQFPRQIARGHGTEEIGDRRSNHARYPENHGINLGALISGGHHLVVDLFGRHRSRPRKKTSEEAALLSFANILIEARVKADMDQMNFVWHLLLAVESGAMCWIVPAPVFKR